MIQAGLAAIVIACYAYSFVVGERGKWGEALLAYTAGTLALFAILTLRMAEDGVFGGN